MATRRQFIKNTAITGIVVSTGVGFSKSFVEEDDVFFESDYLRVGVDKDLPRFVYLSTDSLGKKQFQTNVLLDSLKDASSKKIKKLPQKITWKEYGWECTIKNKRIVLRSIWTPNIKMIPFKFIFSQKSVYCTLLGVMAERYQMKFPFLLHFPNMGSFRVYCSLPDFNSNYDSDRKVDKPFVKFFLNPANKNNPEVEYTFESAAVYPLKDKIGNNPIFDGVKRNYLNVFQINPYFSALANNSASDIVAFTVHTYAEMARKTPELIDGIDAMDLVRNTLDRYLAGMKGYGQVGYKENAWRSEFNSLDTYPSLIMSCCYYILDKKDKSWGGKNYSKIRDWGIEMLSTDSNNDGILQYGYSGNSDSWDGIKRPANWWDTIGFGHDDAYSNALAYRSLILLSDVSGFLGKDDDKNYFTGRAIKLKQNYYNNFFNPRTGVLAGWRSADGHLHDYYFLFVNSVAICYDLVEYSDARKIMVNLLKKMREVGFTDFKLGLPGNLIPIADEDYTEKNSRWGYQNFQVYENGGATGCYAYYTIKALYKLGLKDEAKSIFLPMLESYEKGDFNGICPANNMSKDWKTWKGNCSGYEGFLIENFLTLLNVWDYFDNE